MYFRATVHYGEIKLYINAKKLLFRYELTANDTSKTAKITQKGDITQKDIDILGDVLVGNHLFVIFAVLDMTLAEIKRY